VFSSYYKWRIYKRYVNNTSNPLKFPTPCTHCLAVNVQFMCPLVSDSNVTCSLVTKWNFKWPLLWVKPDVPIGLRVRIQCPFAWVKVHVPLRLRVTLHMSLGIKVIFHMLDPEWKVTCPLVSERNFICPFDSEWNVTCHLVLEWNNGTLSVTNFSLKVYALT